MQREVLVTAGNGMFGHALIAALLGDERVKAVSYTHLTLPTNREV